MLAKNIYHQKKLASKIKPLVEQKLKYIRDKKIKQKKAATTLQKTARYYLKQKKTKNILKLDHTIHSKIPLIIIQPRTLFEFFSDSYTLRLKSYPHFSAKLSSKNFTFKGKLKEDAQQSLKSKLSSQIQEANDEKKFKCIYQVYTDRYGNKTIDYGFNIYFDQISESFKDSIDISFLGLESESPFHRILLMNQLLEAIYSYIYAYESHDGQSQNSKITGFLNEALPHVIKKISTFMIT